MKPYYSAGGITIYHGDCRPLLEELPRPSLVLTDPPYGIGWKRGDYSKRSSKQHAGIQNDMDTSGRDHILSTYADVPAIVFGSFYAPYPDTVKQVLVWQKPPDAGIVGSTTGYRRDAEPVFLCGPWPVRNAVRGSVLRGRQGMSAITTATGHPHTKPVDVLCRLLELTPTGLILDPFMGSGSTLVAAALSGREAIGIELEEQWCAVAVDRLVKIASREPL